MAVETIWDYLESLGYQVEARPEDKTVPFVLESEKMNKAQTKRLASTGMYSEKLDGVFSLITVIPNVNPWGILESVEVRHWNRTGKAMPNCELLDEQLERDLTLLSSPLVFISEVTSDDPLAKLSGYVNPNRVNDSDFTPTNMKDSVHDVVTIYEFIAGVSYEEFHVRYDLVTCLFKDASTDIIPMYHGPLEDAKTFAKEVWARKGEGVVYADPLGSWVAGQRNEVKIKIKEKLSYDVTVVGMVSGKQGSKYEHTLGKLVVAFRAFGDPKGELIWVPISGMTDKERDLWWEHPELIVGRVVKMDAKSFTENGNLREPRYKEERADKESQFPVKVLAEVNTFTKGKAVHHIHEVMYEEY